jgi:hypothetical protein
VYGGGASAASAVRDCLHCTDDGALVCAAGRTVVVLAADGRGQRLLGGSPDAEAVCALALSPNRRALAVAERAAPNKPLVSVYDASSLKRRKLMQPGDLASKVFLCICGARCVFVCAARIFFRHCPQAAFTHPNPAVPRCRFLTHPHPLRSMSA